MYYLPNTVHRNPQGGQVRHYKFHRRKKKYAFTQPLFHKKSIALEKAFYSDKLQQFAEKEKEKELQRFFDSSNKIAYHFFFFCGLNSFS